MSQRSAPAAKVTPLKPSEVRWVCPVDELGFDTTQKLTASHHILGQEDAIDALRFGLESRSQGNNIFVRGLSGFGRMALIHEAVAEYADTAFASDDLVYVHNFERADQPKLLRLPSGRGREFRNSMDEFAEFTTRDVPEYLESDYIKTRQKQLVAEGQAALKAVSKPFEEELSEAGLVMVPMQVGQNTVPVILPIVDGKPAQFEELNQRRIEGAMSEEEFQALIDKVGGFEKKLAELNEQAEEVQNDNRAAMRDFLVEEVTRFVQSRIHHIRKRFTSGEVGDFLEAVKEDLIHRLQDPSRDPEFARSYRVNLISSHGQNASRPVVSVSSPNLANLIGKIDRAMNPAGTVMHSDHLMITPGALIEADGGFLILDAQDLLTEPGAWAALLRTLKSGQVELNYNDMSQFWGTPQLRPEPISIDIKVILVGDPDTYFILDAYEKRFSSLFKVLADFSDTIARDKRGYAAYSNVIARVAERDDLLPFNASAVGKLIEHGARICAQQDRLTSQFGRICDIAREASFIGRKAGDQQVEAKHVSESIARSKRRADLPARRSRRMLANGSLKVAFSGKTVGQVNGLAVTSAGPLTYGFPSRITASIGPGSAGAINLERESSMSGSIHTKGFLILSGLLRYLLRLKHPMAFSASLAFEQTYGGIDGDSASGVEFCCLLSALTEIPVRQDVAMTGAVDQKGNILPIGAVSEKVEGFFDACKAVEFTGTQGVIVPETNAAELMLREDVVEAIEKGEFNVYAISRIDEALQIFFDQDPGDLHNGDYEPSSILALAQEKAHEYWATAIHAAPDSNDQDSGD